jgi:hypothetical protein
VREDAAGCSAYEEVRSGGEKVKGVVWWVEDGPPTMMKSYGGGEDIVGDGSENF